MSNPGLNVEVRVAGPDNTAAIALLRSQWTGVESDPDFEQRMAAWLHGDGERRTTWLARVDAQPVGMGWLFEYRRMPRPGRAESRWGYLSNMFVQEEYRNQGVGSVLLSAIIQTAQHLALRARSATRRHSHPGSWLSSNLVVIGDDIALLSRADAYTDERTIPALVALRVSGVVACQDRGPCGMSV